jgi:competence protein ComEA
MVKGNDPYISKSNRRGVILLILILLLIVFTPRILMTFDSDSTLIVTKEELKQVEELRQESKVNQHQFANKKKKKYRIPPAKFNPNEYSAEQWMALGLSVKQANVVLKFTKRGVYSLSDFEKIFVIPDELMSILKDSLEFPERKRDQEAPVRYQNSKQEAIKVHLNLAEKEEIMELPGVGPYIADRIIVYRERLGGFINKEQLMEIKKIDLELFNKLEGQIVIDKEKITKLKINSASAEELKNHPYLNWSIANSIVKMRTQRGGTFKQVEELLESVLIDRELFEKIKPYLSL